MKKNREGNIGSHFKQANVFQKANKNHQLKKILIILKNIIFNTNYQAWAS